MAQTRRGITTPSSPVFDHQPEGQAAGERLFNLRQETWSAQDFALVYCIFCQHHSDIAFPNMYIFLYSIHLLLICVYYYELLDTTALLELGTKNFPKPARASTKYIYVTNTF
jgi:hypothetical protein